MLQFVHKVFLKNDHDFNYFQKLNYITYNINILLSYALDILF